MLDSLVCSGINKQHATPASCFTARLGFFRRLVGDFGLSVCTSRHKFGRLKAVKGDGWGICTIFLTDELRGAAVRRLTAALKSNHEDS